MRGKIAIDLTGRTLGKLAVRARVWFTRRPHWWCDCECGSGILLGTTTLLRSPRPMCKACSSTRRKASRVRNLTGRKFGRLTAIERVKAKLWRCECECGQFVRVIDDNLISGATRACGINGCRWGSLPRSTFDALDREQLLDAVMRCGRAVQRKVALSAQINVDSEQAK